MKISDAVFRTLVGDNVITGRDDKGLFMIYDRMEIDVKRQEVRMYNGKVLLSTHPSHGVGPESIITFLDIEGRLRMQVDQAL